VLKAVSRSYSADVATSNQAQATVAKDRISKIGLNVKTMREARLHELEEMAAKLLATARKIPPGQDHHNALREVGRFLAQIAALKDADPNASTAAPAHASDEPPRRADS
jgi:hypothetical protein